MRVTEEDGVTVIECTAEQMVRLAAAATATARHGEAIVRFKGDPVLGLRVVEPAPADEEGGAQHG